MQTRTNQNELLRDMTGGGVQSGRDMLLIMCWFNCAFLGSLSVACHYC